MMTNPSAIAITRPVARRGTPKPNSSAKADELDCTIRPMPGAAIAANKANIMPSHFIFNPFCRYHMGPPEMVPSGLIVR
ncbi:hypothetical protein ES703_14044 [subsurface metagenome]